jgi:HK97 gp10 family phage protein
MTAKSGLDISEWASALDQLGSLRVSLARSMAVAGGTILRDEAKRNAPVDTGLLRDSIYLAYKDGLSNEAQIVYSVTWNSKKAPHGHLIEFGHWHVQGGKGGEKTSFTPAQPFLRPAFDQMPRAKAAMIERGRERLPELLAEVNK